MHAHGSGSQKPQNWKAGRLKNVPDFKQITGYETAFKLLLEIFSLYPVNPSWAIFFGKAPGCISVGTWWYAYFKSSLKETTFLILRLLKCGAQHSNKDGNSLIHSQPSPFTHPIYLTFCYLIMVINLGKVFDKNNVHTDLTICIAN